MSGPDSYALDSATNALRVINLLRTKRTVTVTEVSTELKVGKSTAHRLLTTLVTEGFALRDPVHRQYHPGRALVDVGLSAFGDLATTGRGSSPLTALARFSRGSAKLLVLDGRYVRVVDTADGGDKGRIGGAVGQLAPAHATAAGKVLLSAETREAIWTRFEGRLDPVTAHTNAQWDAFLEELAAVRERGWADNDSEASEDVAGLAVPVLGRNDTVVAALAVAATTDDLPRDRRMEVLRHMFATAFELQSEPGQHLPQ